VHIVGFYYKKETELQMFTVYSYNRVSFHTDL